MNNQLLKSQSGSSSLWEKVCQKISAVIGRDEFIVETIDINCAASGQSITG